MSRGEAAARPALSSRGPQSLSLLNSGKAQKCSLFLKNITVLAPRQQPGVPRVHVVTGGCDDCPVALPTSAQLVLTHGIHFSRSTGRFMSRGAGRRRRCRGPRVSHGAGVGGRPDWPPGSPGGRCGPRVTACAQCGDGLGLAYPSPLPGRLRTSDARVPRPLTRRPAQLGACRAASWADLPPLPPSPPAGVSRCPHPRMSPRPTGTAEGGGGGGRCSESGFRRLCEAGHTPRSPPGSHQPRPRRPRPPSPPPASPGSPERGIVS